LYVLDVTYAGGGVGRESRTCTSAFLVLDADGSCDGGDACDGGRDCDGGGADSCVGSGGGGGGADDEAGAVDTPWQHGVAVPTSARGRGEALTRGLKKTH
jgi:hypothetical protein